MSNKVYHNRSSKQSKNSVRKQQQLNDFVAAFLNNFTITDIAELNQVSRETQYKRIRKFNKEVADNAR